MFVPGSHPAIAHRQNERKKKSAEESAKVGEKEGDMANIKKEWTMAKPNLIWINKERRNRRCCLLKINLQISWMATRRIPQIFVSTSHLTQYYNNVLKINKDLIIFKILLKKLKKYI